MRMVSIASGSSGNCIYIGSDQTHILVDAGISNKRIMAGLIGAWAGRRRYAGILITHEHSIIFRGLGVNFQKVSSAHLRYAKDSGGNRLLQQPGKF